MVPGAGSVIPAQEEPMTLLTVREAAEYLRVTEQTIRKMIASGELEAVRLSPRTTRVRLDALREAVEKN